jgi:DNA-binding NtrC family response regulator
MTAALRVLIVEDSETDAKLVMRELRRMGRSLEFERVETEEEMRRALLASSWDLIVSDWSLASFGATAALELLQELELDVPLIVVSGTLGEEVAVEAMRAGARDYLLKFRLTRLPAAVERELAERDARRRP